LQSTKQRNEGSKYTEHHCFCFSKKPKVHTKHFNFGEISHEISTREIILTTQFRLKTVGYIQSLFTAACQSFLGVMLMSNAVCRKRPDSPLLPLLQAQISEKRPIRPEGQHTVQITTQDAGQHDWELRRDSEMSNI